MKVKTFASRYGQMSFCETDTILAEALATYGEFFEGEVNVFRQYCKEGDTVCDIGANIGAHTMALASLVGPKGRVVAVEPQRPMFMLMCTNAVMNNYLQIEPHWAAAGAECRRREYGRLDYDLPGGYCGYQTDLMAAMAVGLNVRELIETVTLDYLQCHKASFMKIDVEYQEINVIKGAATSIELGRPVIYVENDKMENSVDLIRLLRSFDYKLYWHTPKFFNPNNFTGSKRRLPIHQEGIGYARQRDQYCINGASMMLLCLPKGKELPVPKDVIEVGSDDEHPCLPEHWARLLPGFKPLSPVEYTDAA